MCYTGLREIIARLEIIYGNHPKRNTGNSQKSAAQGEDSRNPKKHFVSGLLTQTLVDLVSRQESYEQARQHNLEILRRGYNLGTQGNISWLREDLHERQPRD